MRAVKYLIFARGTATLMAAAFFLTNVIAAHAVENAFWAKRRGAARHMKPGASFPREEKSQNQLLAQLPRGLPASPIGTEVIPSLNSFGPTNPCPTLRSSLTAGDMKKWGWLPELVAPFGDIREIHLSSQPNAPLIVHLQDVHEVEEAQRNLAGLVEAFQTKRGISLVGLEGAVGSFDLERYRTGSSPEAARGLADTFLRLGYLTGPEVAGIVGEKVPTLWGVEDLHLYHSHVVTFQESEKLRTEVRSSLDRLTHAADEARIKIYPPFLRSMDDHRRAYHAHRESLGDYIPTLWDSLKGNREPFPNVARLVKALTWERSLDFKEVERERLTVVDVLARRLSAQSLDQLVQESLAYRAGRLAHGDYQRYLLALCQENNVRLDAYGPLKSYISYVLLAERIDPSKLLEEIDVLESTVFSSLAKTEGQRQLVAVQRGLSLLDKLTLHTLTPTEWEAYKKERMFVRHIPRTLSSLLGHPIPSIDGLLSSPDSSAFEMFCERALDRNAAMVQNLLAKMRADKSNSAVLVAGGFHSEGMARFLRKEGVSYVVVSPKISSLSETTRPLDVFVRAPLPLEKLLAGDVIHLAYARLTQTNPGAIDAVFNGPTRQENLRAGWAKIAVALGKVMSKKTGSEVPQPLGKDGNGDSFDVVCMEKKSNSPQGVEIKVGDKTYVTQILKKDPVKETLIQWIGAVILPAITLILFPDLSPGAPLVGFISFFPTQSFLMSFPGHQTSDPAKQKTIHRNLAFVYVIMVVPFLIVNASGGTSWIRIVLSGLLVLFLGVSLHRENNFNVVRALWPSPLARFIQRWVPFLHFGTVLLSGTRPPIEPTPVAQFPEEPYSDLDPSDDLTLDVRALATGSRDIAGLLAALFDGRWRSVGLATLFIMGNDGKERTGKDIGLDATVRMRAAARWEDTEARIVLSPVRVFGGAWVEPKDRKVIPFPLPRGESTWNPRNGVVEVSFHKNIPLEPGIYEFVVEARSANDPTWKQVIGEYGVNHKIHIKSPQSPDRRRAAALMFVGRGAFFILSKVLPDRSAAGVAGFIEQGVLLLLSGGFAMFVEVLLPGTFFLVMTGLVLVNILLFPTFHGKKVGYFDENEYESSGWIIRWRSITDTDKRQLFKAGLLFFGIFLLVLTIPHGAIWLTGAPTLGPPDLYEWIAGFVSSLTHGLYDFSRPKGAPLALGGQEVREGVSNDQNSINRRILEPGKIEEFKFILREPGSVVAWKFSGFSHLLEYFLGSEKRVLSVADLGAGVGGFLQSLSDKLKTEHSVYSVNNELSVAIDLSPPEGSSVLKGDVSVPSDLSRLNIQPESMDLVVINHVDHRGLSMLPNAWNLVHPGGLLMITVAESDVLGGDGDTPTAFGTVLGRLPDDAKEVARVVTMKDLGYPEASREFSPAFLVAVPKISEKSSDEHSRPTPQNQWLKSAFSVSRVKNLLMEIPFFIPAVIGVVITGSLTCGMTPWVGVAFQLTIGLLAALLIWPIFLRRHARAEKKWIKDNPGKTERDYRFRLSLVYGFITLATVTIAVLFPGASFALSYGPVAGGIQVMAGKIFLGVVGGGFVVHGLLNFFGRLIFGPSFVPGMADVPDDDEFNPNAFLQRYRQSQPVPATVDPSSLAKMDYTVVGYTLPAPLGYEIAQHFYKGDIQAQEAPTILNEKAVTHSQESAIDPEKRRWLISKLLAKERLLEANSEVLRSLFPKNRQQAQNLLSLVKKMGSAFRDLSKGSSYAKESSDLQEFNSIFESLTAQFEGHLETLTPGDILGPDLRALIISSSESAVKWADIKTLHKLINFMHQLGLSRFTQLAKQAEANVDFQVGEIGFSVANLNAHPLFKKGICTSQPLSIFLKATKNAQQPPAQGIRLMVKGNYLQGSIQMGAHSADFAADVVPLEGGGMFRLTFTEVESAVGNRMRLLFLAKLLEGLGMKVELTDEFHLSAIFDKDNGETNRIQIPDLLDLTVRALYYSSGLDYAFTDIVKSRAAVDWLSTEKAFKLVALDATLMTTIFIAEGGIPFFTPYKDSWGPEFQRILKSYVDAEPQRTQLRAALNQTLTHCGLETIPDDRSFGQRVIDDYYTEPLKAALARGEVVCDEGRLKRSEEYHPAEDLARAILGAPEDAMRLAAGLSFEDSRALDFLPIGTIGRLTAGVAQWPLEGGEWIILYGLTKPETGRFLYVTAVRVSASGDRQTLSPKDSAEILRGQGLLVTGEEEPGAPLRVLTESLLHAPPLLEPMPGNVHHGMGVSPGRGWPVAGVVTFDRDYHKKPGHPEAPILAVPFIEPDDFEAIQSARAVLLTSGAKTSHTLITAQELEVPGVVASGARWTQVNGDPRLVIQIQRPHEAKQGEGGLWISIGVEIEERMIAPGSILLVDGERGVVSILSGEEIKEAYTQWRALAEKHGTPEALVASVSSPDQFDALEFVLFQAVWDREVGDEDRQRVLNLLEKVVTTLPEDLQRRFAIAKETHLASLVERTREKQGRLTEFLGWSSVVREIESTLEEIRRRSRAVNELANRLALPHPQSERQLRVEQRAMARAKGLTAKAQAQVHEWSDRTLATGDLSKVRKILLNAQRNGVSATDPRYQLLAGKGNALAQAKWQKIRGSKHSVYFLGEVDLDHESAVGGKFANLGESEKVIQEADGFVPNSLDVTSDAFDKYLVENGIKEAYEDLVRELDVLLEDTSLVGAERSSQVEIKSQEIRDLISAHPIRSDGALGKEILDALDRCGLGNVALMVRSSGIQEDGKTAAFAGGAKSFPIVDRSNVLEKVQETWMSFWLPRGVSYRAHQGIKQSEVRVAVMVQELVNADVSGTMFTTNPSTMDDEVSITAGFGLGEGIEKGLVEYDEYTARKSDGEEINHSIVRTKTKKMIFNRKGEKEIADVDPLDQSNRALSPRQIQRLVHVANALENHYGYPLIIEYCLKDDVLWILQVRANPTARNRQGNDNPTENRGPIQNAESNEGGSKTQDAGGRWPWAQPFYDLFGDTWLGQVAMPVLIEWVVPVGAVLWGMAHMGIPLTPTLLVSGVGVYLLLWHLLHLVGAPGSWKERMQFAFSPEKRHIAYGMFAMALLAALYLNFGVSPGLLGTEILGLLAIPHVDENRRLLKSNLLGGTASGKLERLKIIVDFEALRERVANDRAALDAQRHAMEILLGLASDADVTEIAKSAAQRHQSLSHVVKNGVSVIQTEIEKILAFACAEANENVVAARQRVAETVQAYQGAQKLIDFEKAIVAAIEDKKEIALEITPTMMSGKPETFSLADRAQWRRLEIVARAASDGKLKTPVRLLLAEGIRISDVQRALSLRVGKSVDIKFVGKQKSELLLKEGKYSLNKFVAWIRGGGGSNAGFIDMYLTSRREWVWDKLTESIQKYIRILVDAMPRLVIDETNEISNDIQRLIEVDVKA